MDGRCKCQFRLDWDQQCEHELNINPKFIIGNNNKRHFNRVTYNRCYPRLKNINQRNFKDSQITDERMLDVSVINDHISITSDKTDVINIDGENGLEKGGCVDANIYSKVPLIIDQLELDSQNANVTQNNVTYGGLMNNLTTLARTVQNSQVESKKVFSVIN